MDQIQAPTAVENGMFDTPESMMEAATLQAAALHDAAEDAAGTLTDDDEAAWQALRDTVSQAGELLEAARGYPACAPLLPVLELQQRALSVMAGMST